jgi:FkbM family methyltransferase
VWDWLRRRQNYRRLTVRYASSSWLTIDERCYLQRNIFVAGGYEPEVAETLLGFAVGREVIWDVGANIGSFATLARLDPRVAELICCEPDPGNRAVLEKNLSLNRGASYRVLPEALGCRTEKRGLLQGPPTNRGMTRLLDDSDFGPISCVADCVTLDELVLQRNLPPPTLMKIDVEGWEDRVLKGAENILRLNPPKAIVFESRCNSDGGTEKRCIPELLADFGYTIKQISRRSPTVDGLENFVAARCIAQAG